MGDVAAPQAIEPVGRRREETLDIDVHRVEVECDRVLVRDHEVFRRKAALRIEHAADGGQRHRQAVGHAVRILTRPERLHQIRAGGRACRGGR